MKMLAVYLLVCVMMALTTATGNCPAVTEPETCPRGWTGFEDRCFHYFSTLMTWGDAEKYCQSYGGHLASVHSCDEHRAIQSMILIETDQYPLAWLGGSDSEQDEKWFWSDGSRFRFSNWAPGQPDNRGSGAYCLMMNYGGEKKFDDDACHHKRAFVCAKKK